MCSVHYSKTTSKPRSEGVTDLKRNVFVTRFVRNLCGGSQSFLGEASDGFLYVIKFANNPQGPNVPFNDCIGSELYHACHLPVPRWKRLLVTNLFIEHNPACWPDLPNGRLVPNAGWCFGSRFLGSECKRLLEILPGSSFGRVRNVWEFWLAWIIDICADHTDHRQAIFEESADGRLNPFFIDHGHLFGGPNGDTQRNLRACRYLDARIYRDLSFKNISNIHKRLRTLDADLLWQRAMELPDEWKTKTALDSLTGCLNRLSSAQLVQTLVDEVIKVHKRSAICDYPQHVPPVLHRGISDEAHRFSNSRCAP
jgi:hypothetical protein